MTGAGGQAQGAIVIGVGGIIAPAHIRLDRFKGEDGGRRAQTIPPPIAPDQGECPGGRLAIAFAFEPGDAIAAKRTGNVERARLQAPYAGTAGGTGDDKAPDQSPPLPMPSKWLRPAFHINLGFHQPPSF
jgi:hypothetical protein